MTKGFFLLEKIFILLPVGIARTLRHETQLMLPFAPSQNPKLLLAGTTDGPLS